LDQFANILAITDKMRKEENHGLECLLCDPNPLLLPDESQKEEEQQQDDEDDREQNKTKKEHNRYEEMTREPLRGSQRMCQQTNVHTQIQFVFLLSLSLSITWNDDSKEMLPGCR
jgi:hypothetical protein